MDAYVDALATFTNLVNASPITGAGKPLSNGMVRGARPRSPGSGAVAWVTWISTPWEPSDGDLHTALLSSLVLGTTDDNARRGAIALANYLRGLDGDPILLPADSASVLAVEQITGPSLAPGNEYAYLVDALCNFQPA